MAKIAFKMKLKPGYEKEYEKRHNEIWPELVKLLKKAGISDYNIYLDKETSTLFATQNVNETPHTIALEQTDLMKKWWTYMADIMDTHPDDSPVVVPLDLVFHMD